MANKFYPIAVKQVTRETPSSISVTFDIPENLKEEFTYKHGQYLTLKIVHQGVENRRAYSICSSPFYENDIKVAIKKVDDGVVSKYLNENLKAGDVIELMPPNGHFTIELDANKNRNYCFIGAGSGITPLISIIKSILYVEKQSKIHLIYGNRNENEIIFENEIKDLQKNNPERFKFTTVLSQPIGNFNGLIGRVNNDIIKNVINYEKILATNTEFFLCGPVDMMKNAEDLLYSMNVNKNQIHKESFTVSEKGENMNNESQDLKPRKVKILLYSEELEMLVNPDDTITSAAQREGYDPPYSCQIGACSTCRAKLISGKVIMDERDSLTDDEIEEGYVLTCQAHPLTDDVVLDFDC